MQSSLVAVTLSWAKYLNYSQLLLFSQCSYGVEYGYDDTPQERKAYASRKEEEDGEYNHQSHYQRAPRKARIAAVGSMFEI